MKDGCSDPPHPGLHFNMTFAGVRCDKNLFATRNYRGCFSPKIGQVPPVILECSLARDTSDEFSRLYPVLDYLQSFFIQRMGFLLQYARRFRYHNSPALRQQSSDLSSDCALREHPAKG